MSYDTGQIPSDWKDAIVTPLFKKGNKKSPSNYRPISLTSLIGKVFEKIIKLQLSCYLEHNKIILDSQHGFRQGRSTKSNLLEFSNNLIRDLDNGSCVDVVYLDFQKAFDKVPYNRLINKLKGCGIGGKLLEWLSEWLKNRNKQVRYSNTLSSPLQVKTESPKAQSWDHCCFLYT